MAWYYCSLARQAQMALLLQQLLPNTKGALGIFMGFDGLGAVISSILLSRRAKIKHYGAYCLIGFLLLALGIFGVGIYQARGPHRLLYLSAVIIGLGSGIQLVTFGYLIKKETPPEHIGRVSGTQLSLQNAALAVGTLSSGFLVLHMGIHNLYYSLSVIMGLLAIASFIFLNK